MYGPGISPLLAVASLCALMETHTGDQQMLLLAACDDVTCGYCGVTFMFPSADMVELERCNLHLEAIAFLESRVKEELRCLTSSDDDY